MADTKYSNGEVSIDCLISSSSSSACKDSSIEIPADGNTSTVNPPDHNDGQNTVLGDLSPDMHSYMSRTHIDTTAPFKSVKAAVNLFGGNAGWKTLRTLTKEKSINFEQELTKAEHEICLCLKQLEDSENAKEIALRELEITKKEVDELKIQLEKALIEKTQAQQNFELAELRFNELEKGISTEDSVTMKDEIKLLGSRYSETDNELKSAVFELLDLKKQKENLDEEKSVASVEAEKALLASKEVEKTVEMITVNEVLESAQKSLLKVEEQMLDEAMKDENGTCNWNQSAEQTQALEGQLFQANDLKKKLSTATTLLTSLELEMTAYAVTKQKMDGEEMHTLVKPDNREALSTANNDLEEVNDIIQKTMRELECLSNTVHSLKCEVETEISSLTSLKKSSILTTFLLQTIPKKSQAEHEESENKEKTSHIETQALSATEELSTAIEEAALAKASACAIELRFQTVIKEIENAKASEKLLLDAKKALQESKNQEETTQELVAIHLDEYVALIKRANEAERLANERVVAAVDQIKDAKKTDSMSREKLETSYGTIKERKEALRKATEQVERANEGKLKADQELRNWRAENEQRRKAGESAASCKDKWKSPRCYSKSFDDGRDTNGLNQASLAVRVNSTPIPNWQYSANASMKPPRKKSFFPRIIRLMTRKTSK